MIVNPNAIRVKPWSMARRETFLKSQAERAKHMIMGALGQELSAALTLTKEQLDESRVYFAELCASADGGDRVAQSEMQEIRIWSVQNFLVAGLNYGSFFEVLNLEKGDVPYIENTTRQEAMVSFVGQDGGEVRWQAFVNWTNTQIPAFWLTSNDFEYPLVDEYTGEVADRSKSNVDIAFDLNMKLDAILFGYLQALIGVFNNAGDPATLRPRTSWFPATQTTPPSSASPAWTRSSRTARRGAIRRSKTARFSRWRCMCLPRTLLASSTKWMSPTR
jgi:hypothetical protein